MKVERIVRHIGKYVLDESRTFNANSVEVKGLHDFVSYVDKTSEAKLVKGLENIIPDAGFIVEEGSSSRVGERYNWVIDPLDGTTNFIHGLKPYAISVALTLDGKPVLGVINDVSNKEVFTAWEGGGAWLNQKRIYSSTADRISKSLIGTGLPYYNFDRLPNYMECLSHLCKVSHGVRRIGAASVDLAYVACGRFDAFFEYGLKPWDIAAGTIIVREAGGEVSTFNGVTENLTGFETLAANKYVYQEFLKTVESYLSVK